MPTKNNSRGAVLLIVVILLVIVGAGLWWLSSQGKSNLPTDIVSPTSTPAKTGITPEEAAQLIPVHPSQVTAEAVEGAVLMKWRGTGEDTSYYQVYRKAYKAEEWQQLATVEVVGENRGWYEYSDTTIKKDTTYIYGVSAVGIYGKKSLISESDAITPK